MKTDLEYFTAIEKLRNTYREKWIKAGKDMRKAVHNKNYEEAIRFSNLEYTLFEIENELDKLLQ